MQMVYRFATAQPENFSSIFYHTHVSLRIGNYQGGLYAFLDIYADHGSAGSTYYGSRWQVLYEKTTEKNQQHNWISYSHVYEKQNDMGICPQVLRKDLVYLRNYIIAVIYCFHVPCDGTGQGYHRKCRADPVRRSDDFFGCSCDSHGNGSQKEFR
jgi:hypothetical protein